MIAPLEIALELSPGDVESRDDFSSSRGRWIAQVLSLMVRREISPPGRGPLAGLAWAMVQPLLWTALYALVFRVSVPGPLAARDPLFVLAGMVPWSAMASGLLVAGTSLVGHGPLLRAHPVPPAVFPLAASCVSTIHLVVTLLPLWLWSTFSGASTNSLSSVGWLIPLVGAHLTLTFSLGLILAHAHARVRAVHSALQLALRAGVLVTPVLWTTASVGGLMAPLLAILNPAAPLVEGVRSVLLEGSMPTSIMMALGLWCLVAVGAAFAVDRQGSGTVADWV